MQSVDIGEEDWDIDMLPVFGCHGLIYVSVSSW